MQLLPSKKSKTRKRSKKVKQSRRKIGARKIQDGTHNRRGKPIEDMFQLATMLRVELDGRQVGGYVLRKGENSFMLQFGFECSGIHATLQADQVDAIFDTLETGIKDFLPGEDLTVHLSSFTSDVERQRQLKQLAAQAPSQELQYLIMAERARVQELTDRGLRKPKTLRLYATYTVEPDTEGTADMVEKFLARGERFWKGVTGELDNMQFVRIERLLAQAYTDGFQRWEQLLANKIGLQIRALSDVELWEIVWHRFNNSPPIHIPQVLVLGENGLQEIVHSEISPLTLLMEDVVPVADRQWIHLKNSYIGVMSFLDKPGGWLNKYAQMRYLWEIMAKEKVYDTEIFCQVTRANQALVKTNMQRLTKQANTATDVAAQGGSIDVMAHLNIQKGVDAQAALYEGAVPFHTSVVFLVHRPTRKLLSDSCRYLSSLFLRPAWVGRELEYPWRIWLQTFPIIWERLLTKPFDRRHIYLNSEVIGLLPLVKPRTTDNRGLELIADEGGVPIFVDLYTQHKNLALFGTTRSGKSVMAAGILTQALAYGMPVVAMDYPKPDGTSTFTDYAKFMGERGAYFNISTESSNLFELPDLRSLSVEEQMARLEDYKDFLISALLMMVVGSKSNSSIQDQSFSTTVRSILTIALDVFLGDDIIRDRYAQSFRGGFGSDLWETMPTLQDFIGFCSYERLRIEGNAEDIKIAMQQIKLRLNFWLTSRVGKSISRPSTFRSDAQLLIFALANLSNDEDAAVLSLSAYSAALRRSLASPASIFFIDESPILFEYDAISKLVARLCANGAKAGIRVILSGQDPDTIANSPGGSKIFQNISTRLIGRIQTTAIDSFTDIFKYPYDIISQNATENFFPKREGIYSRWLVDHSGTFTHARYYPAYQLLAAVANNPDEQAARTETLAQYKNKFVGMSRFAKKLVASIRNGTI